VRVADAGRALPLAFACYRPHGPPRPLPGLARGLLRPGRGGLPPGCAAVLLAGRGLCRPAPVDACRESGWHYVLRLQGQTRVRLPDGSVRSARGLAPRAGARWLGAAEAFRTAGWRGAGVVATWEPGMREPWLLLTDERASLRHRRAYAQRVWAEESFRDDKSAGFRWEASRGDDPAHAGRSLPVLAPAMALAAGLGGEAVEAGRRRRLEGRRGRRLSAVQVGLRWLRDAVAHGSHHLLRLGRLYLYPK
jgi:hypothetical protein